MPPTSYYEELDKYIATGSQRIARESISERSKDYALRRIEMTERIECFVREVRGLDRDIQARYVHNTFS